MAHLITSRRARPAALALVLAAGAVWFSCTEPPPQPMMPSPAAMLQDSDAQEQERLANNDSFQKRPLWFPKIDVEASTGANGWTDLAVDSRNIVHMTYQNTTGASPPYTNAIHYRNDRYESRGKSGFSGTYTVASDGEHPEIAADAQDNIHVIWSVVEAGVRVLKYRHFDRSTGSWISAFSITDSDNHMDFPHLETDASNIVHIAYVRLDAASGNATQIRYIKSTQSKPTLASHFAASERVDHTIANPTPLKDKPRMDIDSGNVAHVGWIDSGANLGPGDNVKMLYGSRTGGSWSAPIRISNNASGTTVASCDLSAAYSTTLQHFVWEEVGGANAIQYRKNLSGTLGTVKKINVTGTTVSVPRVISDSRTQPHILYNTDAGTKQGYASKVKRPKDSDGKDKWGRREPIEADAPSVDTMEMVANQNDNLYAVFGKEIVGSTAEPIYFSQTYEPNLGAQDSGVSINSAVAPNPLVCLSPRYPMMVVPRAESEFGQYDWAPNSVANAHNGNMTLVLPIFSSDGVGFSTKFSLIYNSLEWAKGCMAPGWMHNYHMVLTDHGGTNGPKSLILADGMRVVFKWDATATRYLAEDYFAVFSSIRESVTARDGQSASYLLEDKFGNQTAFTALGKLDRLIDTQSAPNKMTFSYTQPASNTNPETGQASSLLTTITDSTGQSNRTTLLDYDAKNRLDEVQDMNLPTRKIYTIEYATGENGKVSRVVFPETGVEWKFEYHASNDLTAGNKKRINLMWKIQTPRAVAGVYFWELRWRQDNRALSATDPSESLITNDTDIDAAETSVQTNRQLVYEEPNLPFETPNTRKPDQVNSSYQLTVEAEEEPTSNPTVSITGNNVPKVKFQNERGCETKTEYQYLRSLADNVTDPNAKFLRRFFNGSISGAPTTVATYRNLTVYTDKRGTATKYEYQSSPTPSWVKDNLTKIHPPKNGNNESSAAPGADFEAAVEYTYTSDSLNRVATFKDSLGNTTTYTRDAYGNVLAIAYPPVTLFNGNTQNATETFTIDSKGRVTASTDAECGASTTYSYTDAQTGLVTEILAPGSTKPWLYTYTNMGHPKDYTQPEGGTWIYTRDNLYRVTKVTEPHCSGTMDTEFCWNADSLLTCVVCIEGKFGNQIKTGFVYNKLGSLTENHQFYLVGDSPANFAYVKYDRRRNVRRTLDYLGNIATKSLYDCLDRVTDTRQNLSSTVSPPPSDVFSQTTFTYDENGNTLTVTREGGALSDRITTMTYNPRNTLKTVTNPDTTVDTIEYDANDDVTKRFRKYSSTFLFGSSTAYDQRRRVKSTTQLSAESGGGLTTGYLWDRDNNSTETIDPMNRFVKRFFDCRKRLVRIEDGKCVTQTLYVYDENDRIIEIWTTDPRTGGPELVRQARFEYCPDNKLLRTYDANNVLVEENTYDLAGNLQKRKDANGVRTKYAYNYLKEITSITEDANDTGWTGRLNIVTQFTWSANSNLSTILLDDSGPDPDHRIDFKYTKGNQREKIEYERISGSRRSETWTYNNFAEVATHVDANGKTATISYTTMGLVSSVAHGTPFSITITNTYTQASMLDTIDDGTIKIDYDHDIFLRTSQVRWFNPVSTLFKTLSYTYDDASNRASMTGAEGEVVSYSYDANNLLLSISRQKGTSSAQFLSIAYDAGNRRRSMTFGNGVTETFLRDIKGQILRLLHTRSDGSVVSSVSYTYDDMGTRKSMTWDHLGVTGTFGYDGLYRLIAERWSGNRGQVGYVNLIGSNIGNESGYSPVGKGTPAALTEVAAHYQDYTFDRWGNRLSLNGNTRTASVSYDNENRINQETPGTMSKITGTTAAASDTESGYNPSKANDGDITDAANSTYAWRSQDVTGQHWLEISWASAKTVKQVRVYIPTSPGTVQRFKVQYWDGFAWVDANVLTAVNASVSGGWYSTSYHENLFRITPVSTTKVRYLQDSGGGTSSTPNIAWINELEAYEDVAGSVVTYTHDSNGNVTKRQTDANNFEDFGYDYANRLNLYKKTTSGSLTVHYTYLAAPTGDRFRKRNELATGGTIQDYQFVYDARDCVADYEKPANGSLAFVRDYVQGLDIDSKVARVESDGTTRFYAGDALGSVTHLLDSAAAVLNTTLTNAWGESMVTSQPTADRFGFTQRENDSESGVMHYRARWYDPRLGRFGGKDPLGDVFSHYVYATNDPLMRSDPLGEQDVVTEVKTKLADAGEVPLAIFKFWFNAQKFVLDKFGDPRVRPVGSTQLQQIPPSLNTALELIPTVSANSGGKPMSMREKAIALNRALSWFDQFGVTDIVALIIDPDFSWKDLGLWSLAWEVHDAVFGGDGDLVRNGIGRSIIRIGKVGKGKGGRGLLHRIIRIAMGRIERSAKSIHNEYANKVLGKTAKEKTFRTQLTEGRLSTRVVDHFDETTGTAYEFNTTPWKYMTEKKLQDKLDQVASDIVLVKEGKAKNVVWYMTEELPRDGLGGILRKALEDAKIIIRVVPQ